jgi:hypothetical protein
MFETEPRHLEEQFSAAQEKKFTPADMEAALRRAARDPKILNYEMQALKEKAYQEFGWSTEKVKNIIENERGKNLQ